MSPRGPDASNSCLPPSSAVIISAPPVPSASRGERCSLDGLAGRINAEKAVLAYGSGKLVVVRNLDNTPLLPDHNDLPVLCYRGHHYSVTASKLAPSGAYMVSGDERGMLRVWAFDHPEHLCKYDSPGLSGVIRDLAWDGESKRICLGGERSNPSSQCARCLQWDTGVTVGELAQHLKGRVSAVAMKPNRPFRIVTAGKDDTKTYFHKGPPFSKLPVENGVPTEKAHSKGAVTSVRYSPDGSLVVSVSTDRSIVTYDGRSLEIKHKLDGVHTATIYDVAWSGDGGSVLTAAGDGTCKLFSVAADGNLTETKIWKPAEFQRGCAFDKVPVGGAQLGCAFVKGTCPVSVGLNGQICILPTEESSDPIRVLTGHYAAIAGLAIDKQRNVFYTGDSDGILCAWDLASCEPKWRIEPPEGNNDLMYVVHGGAVSTLSCLKDGSLHSTGWDDKIVTTLNGSKSAEMNPLLLGAQPVASASGSMITVVATVQGMLVVRNGQVSQLTTIGYEALAVQVTKDDQTVFVGGADCKIYVYSVDGDELKEKTVLENGHLKPIHALALSNDETKLAAGDQRDVCVWDLSTLKPIVGKGRWCFHVQKVTALTWSPNDQVIASGGADDSIYLWSLTKKMKRIHYPYAHRGGLTSLTFVGDGMKLLSTGSDSVVNMWNVAKDVSSKFA